jgi:hypothetical protein
MTKHQSDEMAAGAQHSTRFRFWRRDVEAAKFPIETQPVAPPDDVDAAEAIVAGLYRQILKRTADPAGLVTYGRLIKMDGIPNGVERIVRQLLDSYEYTKVRPSTLDLKAALAISGTRLVNGKKIKHIASLGSHCLTSSILKKHHLKSYSLPFDWLFASPAAILDCLVTDFKTFLAHLMHADA